MLRRSITFALALACALAPMSARADAGEPSPENVKAASQHFKNARELYQSGSYREAVSELEFAETLDPSAKDLVYNLGIVSEKLGNIDAAIKHFRRYLEMDLDSGERSRAEAFVKRLEGAKRELPPPPKPEDAEAPRPAPPPPPVQARSSPKLTAVLVTGAVVGAAGIALGSVLGAKALSDRPQSGAVTSSSYPYATFANAQIEAHNTAVIADVALGIGIAAAATTFFLWVATRPRAPIYLSHIDTAPKLAAMAASSGGGVSLNGRF